MKYIFNCILNNKGDSEEDFEIEVKATSLIMARKQVDEYLQANWGWITKQIYKNERMRSDRYWELTLIRVSI